MKCFFFLTYIHFFLLILFFLSLVSSLSPFYLGNNLVIVFFLCTFNLFLRTFSSYYFFSSWIFLFFCHEFLMNVRVNILFRPISPSFQLLTYSLFCRPNNDFLFNFRHLPICFLFKLSFVLVIYLSYLLHLCNIFFHTFSSFLFFVTFSYHFFSVLTIFFF